MEMLISSKILHTETFVTSHVKSCKLWGMADAHFLYNATL